MNQLSRKDAKAQGHKFYFTGKPCKHGHICQRETLKGNCVDCKIEWSKSPQKKEYDQRRFVEKTNEDPKFARKRYEQFIENNPDYHKEQYRKKIKENPNRGKEQYINAKERYKENARQRKRKLKQRTFQHEQQDILEFYKNRPEGYEVDHEIPINHPLVCGLHNKANLQYLTIEDNRRKSNNWTQE